MNNLHKIQPQFSETILAELWQMHRSLNRNERRYNIWLALDLLAIRTDSKTQGYSPMYYRRKDDVTAPWTVWHWEDQLNNWINAGRPPIDFSEIEIHSSKPTGYTWE